MWPAKLPGEGVCLQQACVAMCSIMKSVGIAVDGGKDSLSMATRLENNEIVKSPGSYRSVVSVCSIHNKKYLIQSNSHNRDGNLFQERL